MSTENAKDDDDDFYKDLPPRPKQKEKDRPERFTEDDIDAFEVVTKSDADED